MNNKLIILILIGLFSPFNSLYAGAQENGVDIYVSKIKIKKSGEITKKQIQQNMAIEFPSILPWKPKAVFDEEIFKEDILRIANLYKENGYYDVQVDYEVAKKEDKKVDLFIQIDKGERTALAELDIQIDPPIDDGVYAQLLDSITLKEGGFFSAVEYQHTKGIIASFFSNRGYPFSDIDAQALVNRKELWAKVSIKVDTGEKYYFGKQTVLDNSKIDEYIIRREFLYKPGDEYSLQRLDKTRLSAFGLGYFKSVVIDTDFDKENKLVDTDIKVEEKKLGSVKLGVGYGTEDKLRGQIIWNQRNLFGGGRNLEVAGKFSFLTQRLGAELYQPYIFGTNLDLISSLSTTRDDFPSYTSETLQLTNKIDKKIFENVKLSTSFDIQLSRLSDISESTSDFIEDEEFFLTFLNIGMDRTVIDNALDPKNGTSLSFSLESSLDFLGSDENFIKGIFEFKGYKKLLGIVFAKRIDVGVIQSFSGTEPIDVPIFKRFFAGGSTTMRGFAFQELGPLDDNDDPVGGNTLLLGNLEARYPIYKKLGGVLFLDYGNVYPDEFDFDLGDIKYAVGTGLRFDTIIGPIRADIGYTLNPEPDIDRFQFFLSIGHAF